LDGLDGMNSAKETTLVATATTGMKRTDIAALAQG
jgi:hypothetical protein